MALNSKIIGGLAWIGLVVVLAVPSADIVSSQLSPKSSLAMTADTDQVQTALIADPVESTGKPVPSFLSGTPAPAISKPTVRVLPPSGSTTQPPVSVDIPTVSVAPMPGIEVAAIDPIAPVPAPAHLRPRAPVVTDPLVTGSVTPAPIVEEDVAALPETVRRRPARVEEPRYITEDELADWDSGTLADYLDRRGLMSDAPDDSSTAEYDPDGFFLDEGPNGREFRSRSRRDFDDGFFVVFPD